MSNTRSVQINKWKKIIVRRMRINSLVKFGFQPLFSAKHMIAQLKTEDMKTREGDSINAI